MLTKSDKIAKKSDSRLSDVLGRDGISVLPFSGNIGYILCDVENLSYLFNNRTFRYFLIIQQLFGIFFTARE